MANTDSMVMTRHSTLCDALVFMSHNQIYVLVTQLSAQPLNEIVNLTETTR